MPDKMLWFGLSLGLCQVGGACVMGDVSDAAEHFKVKV